MNSRDNYTRFFEGQTYNFPKEDNQSEKAENSVPLEEQPEEKNQETRT